MVDTSEMEDIFEDIENEYDENDNEFFDDSLDFDSSSDLSNDSGLPDSSTNTSGLLKNGQEDMDEYLEKAWKQMEMDVEAELRRKEEISGENIMVADSKNKIPENLEKTQSFVQTEVFKEALTFNETPRPERNETCETDSGQLTFSNIDENLEKTEKVDDLLGIWVPDAMLPADSGFMIKKCASKKAKTYIKTPDGQVFDSRRKVLQEMLKNGIYPQLYGYMYQGLLQDGWTINQSLPEGWLYKYNKIGSDSFLDQSFNLYATRRKAREKIEEMYGNFSAALKRFDEQRFKREKTVVSSPPREMQHNNGTESLPKGFKRDPSTQIIICPSGNHYNSRVEAFQQMCRQQQSDDLRREMFDKLIFEGFQAHELLAPGWIYKQDNYQLSFLDYNGIYLHSLSEAQQHFKEIFSLEEYTNFETFLSTIFGEVKTEEDPANTVPEGWSVTEEGVTGPGGKHFSSRLVALITLLETGEREQEAEIMRQCLYYEGWSDDQYLPYMWKYKLDPETGVMMFLTREGGVLGSPGEAVTFIRAHSPPFTPEDVQRIDYVSSRHLPGQEIEHVTVEALEERENVSQPQRPDYSEDNSLPRGWKIKLEWTGKGQCILSPSGTVFKSRRSAYETMVAEKCSNEDIEAMRSVLKYEGWLDNPELPEGWKIKPTKTNTFYIDRGGQMFNSAKQAAKFVRDYSQFFSQEDIEKINKIANINQPLKEKKELEWNVNDPLIPPGWMSRMGKKRRMVKKPDGIVFKSLRMALEHLMKYKKVSEAEVIRECLLHEGWARMAAPHNWLYKPDAGRNYTIIFLSEDGIKFESKAKAINHLREINQFSEELRTIFDNAGKENKKRPNKPDRTPPGSSWALDNSLPENWKSKQSKVNNQHIKMVMSPEGRVFESVVKAYKYLCEQEDNEDMKQDKISMKKYLLNDHGYQESKSLPSGWIFKEDSTNQINFITGAGLRFSSVDSARSHLLRSKQDEESARIFEEFVSEFSKNRYSKMTKMHKLLNNPWVDNDETVPRGWSTKQKKDTTMIKLPDGNEFSSRTSALQHLISIKADEDCILELRGCLKHEGWLSHANLPRNWFYKDFFSGNKQSILFLTKNGELIRSLDDAVQHIKKDSDSTEQEIENIENFVSSLKSDTNKQVVNRKPIDLESVHRNDKMKLEGIQWLLNSEDEVKIKRARSHLKERGWEENIYLPVSWMTKIPKQTSLINVMSPRGQLFNSYKALIGFLKENPDYQEDDVRRLSSFPDGKKHKKVEALINSSLTSGTQVAEKTSSGSRTLKHYITAVRSKSGPLEILKIKKCLLESGWKEDESVIPRNWLLRQRPGLTTITFVTDTGELLGNVKEANKFLKERGNGHTFYIDGEKCKSLFVDNYELELKRIEKFTKSKGAHPANLPASRVQRTGKEHQENLTKNYVKEKFSLDVLDMDRNKPISGFKNMFQQLEKFKKSVLSSPSTNSSFDFDLL